MKIEKATTRLHPITWISIGLNIFFSYYVLNLRVSFLTAINVRTIKNTFSYKHKYPRLRMII